MNLCRWLREDCVCILFFIIIILNICCGHVIRWRSAWNPFDTVLVERGFYISSHSIHFPFNQHAAYIFHLLLCAFTELCVSTSLVPHNGQLLPGPCGSTCSWTTQKEWSLVTWFKSGFTSGSKYMRKSWCKIEAILPRRNRQWTMELACSLSLFVLKVFQVNRLSFVCCWLLF